MKNRKRKLTDDEVYAIENGDEINDGIYSPNTYEEQCLDDFHEQLYCILEGIGYLQYVVDRYAKAERNLRTIETLIIGSIGKDSYEDIMDLIDLQKGWLNRDIKESWKSYDDLNLYINNIENHRITIN
jgi:hypothetical protein